MVPQLSWSAGRWLFCFSLLRRRTQKQHTRIAITAMAPPAPIAMIAVVDKPEELASTKSIVPAAIGPCVVVVVDVVVVVVVVILVSVMVVFDVVVEDSDVVVVEVVVEVVYRHWYDCGLQTRSLPGSHASFLGSQASNSASTVVVVVAVSVKVVLVLVAVSVDVVVVCVCVVEVSVEVVVVNVVVVVTVYVFEVPVVVVDSVVVVVVSVTVVVVVDVLVTVVDVVEHRKLAHAQVSCKQFCILAKSVTSVISQQLIGPHFAAAAVGSLSQSPKPL